MNTIIPDGLAMWSREQTPFVPPLVVVGGTHERDDL